MIFGRNILLMAIAACVSWAQSSSGSVMGTVADSQHLAVSQTSVEVRSDQGQALRTVFTDQQGRFIIDNLAPGHYSLRFSHAGFKLVERELTVPRADGTDMSISLEVGDISQTVNVTEDLLRQPVATSSRLGLLPIETPAAINILNSEALVTRGLSQVEEAVRTMPGAYAGGTPEAPSGFVVRGFSNNQVVVLRDGIYAGPAGMITRPQNSFNLQSVELLSGPSSVLYGQGAVGGTINEVTKPATFTSVRVDGYASYGSFNSFLVGLGAGGQINKSLAFRSDFSYASSDGYVDGSHSNSLNGTGSLLWNVRSNLQLKLSLDAMKDMLPSYYGTPYVSATFGTDPLKGVVQTSNGMVLDARMRYKNYNVSDNVADALSFMPRASLRWEPLAGLTVTDEFYYYHANRNWENAETYDFVGPKSGITDSSGSLIPGNVIARDRFHVFHKENLPGNTLNVVLARKVFGMENKLSGGFQYYNVSFLRSRGFQSATYADYVDPLNPTRGLYGNFAGDFPSRVSPTKLNDKAGFFEDALTVGHGLTLVGGIRFDTLYLNRLNFLQSGALQTSTSFSNSYQPVSYRGGAVYRIALHLTAYGQFSTGTDPAGSSNIFLVNASQNFTLSSSKQGEVGLKSVLPRNLGEVTAAVYNIDRNNILTRTAQDVVSNTGSQRSRGVEFSAIMRPVRLVNVNFNTAYTNAKYGYFLDTSSNALYSGNHPADIPSTTTNLWITRERVNNWPLEIGGGLHFVGQRYADFANKTKLLNYSTVDIFGTYHLSERWMLTARAKNVFDKAYGLWADTNYPNDLLLGAPRSFEVSLRTRF